MATYTVTINEKTAHGKAIALLLSSSPGVELHKNKSLSGIQEKAKSPYNSKFVAKIKKASKESGRIINPLNVWESIK